MAGHIATSQSVDWNTPDSILNPVRDFFGGLIHLDPCSNDNSTVDALASFSLPVDGLAQVWNYPTIFVNPPYGKDKERKSSIKDWVEKCNHAYYKWGSQCIALIPAAVDTRHWQDSIFDVERGTHRPAAHICYIKGRVRFVGNTKGPAPMACAIVYWGPADFRKFTKHFRTLGYCADVMGQLVTGLNAEILENLLLQGHNE